MRSNPAPFARLVSPGWQQESSSSPRDHLPNHRLPGPLPSPLPSPLPDPPMTTNPMQTCLFADAAPRPPLAAWRSALGRLHPRHCLTSLKGRLVLGALFALVVGMALTAWQMGQFAQAQMLARAQERELAEARHMAAILGHRVHEMQRALQVVGQQIDAATFNDPARLAAFFAHQPVLQTLYTSVFAAGADGRIRLLLDAGGPRTTPTSISDREYFQRAMATGRAVISDPIEGRVVNEPMIIFAVYTACWRAV
jgi:hypothetical protein